MSSGYVAGGGNLLQISDAITSEHVFSGSTHADWDHEFNQIGTVNVTRDSATGIWGFTLTQIQDDSALASLIETIAPALTGGEVEEFTYTDGTIIGGTTGASPDLVALNYGAIHTVTNQRKLTAAIVKAQIDMGAYDEESGSLTKPTAVFVGQRAKAAVTIPSAMLCTALITSPANITIAINTGGKQAFFTPA